MGGNDRPVTNLDHTMPEAFTPTPEQREIVRLRAALGFPQDYIAHDIDGGLPITTKTLRRQFRNELNWGMHRANEEVGGVLYRLILYSNDEAIKARVGMWWMERRAAGFYLSGEPENNNNIAPPRRIELIVTDGRRPMIEANVEQR